ncbi:hypothetical protein BOW28_08145 [Solemya velum gill symbiont]|uniref:tyrosine-type recombinase/integrase n=1 Tax=Solemya velum gill symbiont TaxID=2340 RepID=UPI0009978608|nr:tyrosine-type recombinase/integrase [Solemya velum gill symbiont]OOZ16958.1 hypothetical protein BOW28_08145 [Solemya velum gill symbiont]OOZ26395.1 hypothetical protein BOW32_08405 [Solemya velum gill symbiont]
MKIDLTQDMIDQGLTCPVGKRKIEYCDAKEVPGLYVLVTSSASANSSYYLRWKQHGKTKHTRIARVTDITLAEARSRALTLRREIATGNLTEEREQKRKQQMTYSDLFEEYVTYKRPFKRSIGKDIQFYNLRIKARFGSRLLSSISRHDLQKFQADLIKEELSEATADLYLRLLKHSMSLAEQWEYIEKSPGKGLKLFNPDNAVENHLSKEELKRLVDVLMSDENRPVCQIVLWLLSTGARLNEALKARWEHIDRNKRQWTIPATNAKSKRSRVVPLNDTAMGILEQLETEGQHETLWVNTKTGKRYTTIQKVWQRLRLKAGLPHFRLHDARHSFAAMVANDGTTSLYAIGTLLGHKSNVSTRRYAKYSSDTLQSISNHASDVIQDAMNGDT